MKKMIRVVVEECSRHYNFDVEEAMSKMDLEKKSVSVSVRLNEVKVVEKYPMPFNGEKIEYNCQALRQNHGLYTQCKMSKKVGEYCKSCAQLSSKSEDGIPEYGTIEQRLAVDIFEYVDPKGRKPCAYTKIMKKNKITEEQVQEEANRLGLTINPKHFIELEETKRGRPATTPKEPKEPKGNKGRPKKTNKVVQIEETEDLFASLVASASALSLSEESESCNEEKLAAEKAEKKAKLEAEKAVIKAEKEAKIAAEKAEKEAKLAAEKEAKLAAKAEKEAKIAAEKAEKEAKLAAAKESKLAAKAEKKPKQPKQEKKEESKQEKKEESKQETESEETEETYKKCGEVNGKKYIRSQQTGIVYDFDKYTETEELYPVGKWNTEKKEIMFSNDDEDSELSDDEIDDE
jgi:hypothetical protein